MMPQASELGAFDPNFILMRIERKQQRWDRSELRKMSEESKAFV